MTELSQDNESQELLGRISQHYAEGRRLAWQSVNAHLTETYWKIGHDLVEYEQGGQAKADYGKALLATLSRDLTLRHGKGFSRSHLVRFRQFYLAFPNGATLSHQLNWSHIVELLKLDDSLERRLRLHLEHVIGQFTHTRDHDKSAILAPSRTISF